jgi:hypothetical protein
VAQTSVCALCRLKGRSIITLLALRNEGSPEELAPAALPLNPLTCYALTPMSDPIKEQTNSALWLGLLITVLGILSNLLYFLKVPAAALPWLNLTLPAIGLIFLLIGVVRAFGQSQIYRGKVWGSIAAGLAALFLAASAWFFVQVRNIPRSVGAPQVGQRVPDFTLLDSNGQPVALAQLFAASPGMPQPKAVLLVFYRGYW